LHDAQRASTLDYWDIYLINGLKITLILFIAAKTIQSVIRHN